MRLKSDLQKVLSKAGGTHDTLRRGKYQGGTSPSPWEGCEGDTVALSVPLASPLFGFLQAPNWTLLLATGAQRFGHHPPCAIPQRKIYWADWKALATGVCNTRPEQVVGSGKEDSG